MIRGIGVDIIEIERVRQLIEKHGQRFLDRCFTSEEQTYCLKYDDPSPSFAARYAAKEAVAKALGTGIGEFLSWTDIEVTRNQHGQPGVQLSQRAIKAFGDLKVHLSLSHEKAFAIAQVVVES